MRTRTLYQNLRYTGLIRWIIISNVISFDQYIYVCDKPRLFIFYLHIHTYTLYIYIHTHTHTHTHKHTRTYIYIYSCICIYFDERHTFFCRTLLAVACVYGMRPNLVVGLNDYACVRDIGQVLTSRFNCHRYFYIFLPSQMIKTANGISW